MWRGSVTSLQPALGVEPHSQIVLSVVKKEISPVKSVRSAGGCVTAAFLHVGRNIAHTQHKLIWCLFARSKDYFPVCLNSRND